MYTLTAKVNCMLLFDFQSKLRKLDPRLYVKTDKCVVRENSLKHTGLYYKAERRTQMNVDSDSYGQVSPEHVKYLQALERGELDAFICGICLDIIPEYDIFNLEYTRLAIPGWRTIALRIVEAKAAKLDQVRKAFECSSLGETDYDKKSFFQKLEFAKRLAHA